MLVRTQTENDGATAQEIGSGAFLVRSLPTSSVVQTAKTITITTEAYTAYLSETKLGAQIKSLLRGLGRSQPVWSKIAQTIEASIRATPLPKKIETALVDGLKTLGANTLYVLPIVVGGSLPNQTQLSFGIHTKDQIIAAFKEACIARFSEEALVESIHQGYDYTSVQVVMQVGVIASIRSSGFVSRDTRFSARAVRVATTLGAPTPEASFDRFHIGFTNDAPFIFGRQVVQKKKQLRIIPSGIAKVPVVGKFQKMPALKDATLHTLASYAELVFSKMPNVSELAWFEDNAGSLVVYNASEEAAASEAVSSSTLLYRLLRRGSVLATGTAVGQAVVHGTVVVAKQPVAVSLSTPSVVVVGDTSPVWDQTLRTASAVISTSNDRESYEVQFCREMGILCLYGVTDALKKLHTGQVVTVSTVDGPKGQVYSGHLPFTTEPRLVSGEESSKRLRTKVMATLTRSSVAPTVAHLPVAGVGLLSEESLYETAVGFHPLALRNFESLTDVELKKSIKQWSALDRSPTEAMVRRLAESITETSLAFGSRDVYFRFSSATTEEYRALPGGAYFETSEKNPLLGLRGVSRFLHPDHKASFELSCQAVVRARKDWGQKNISLIVPFCRTVEEGRSIVALLKTYGLERGQDGLKIFVMCELPANVLMAKELVTLFDGFIVSLENLSQFTFAKDTMVFSSERFNEEEVAMKQLLSEVIRVAHRAGRTVTVCDGGRALHPSFITFLAQERVDALSVTPDAVTATRALFASAEATLGSSALRLPQAVLSRSISMAGLSSLSMLLVGFTCQTVSDADILKQVEARVEERLVVARSEAREAAIKHEAEKFAEAKHVYRSDSFARFEMAYPALWNTLRTDEESVSVGDGTLFFEVRSRTPQATDTPATTTTWNGLPARSYTGASSTVAYLDVYPEGYTKTKKIIRLSGSAQTFESILQSITTFTVPVKK